MRRNQFKQECFLDFLDEKENQSPINKESFSAEETSREIRRMIQSLDDQNLPKQIRAKMVQKIRNRFSAQQSRVRAK